jgi:hypothetical protein
MCVFVCNKISKMRNLNSTLFLFLCGNYLKINTTPGQPNPGTPLSKNKASYKTLVLTYLLCISHTFNSDTKPIVNASQPDILPEGVFDGFLYLRADP